MTHHVQKSQAEMPQHQDPRSVFSRYAAARLLLNTCLPQDDNTEIFRERVKNLESRIRDLTLEFAGQMSLEIRNYNDFETVEALLAEETGPLKSYPVAQRAVKTLKAGFARHSAAATIDNDEHQAMLAALRQEKISVRSSAGVLVPTNPDNPVKEHLRRTHSGPNGKNFKAQFEPRLQWLVEGLLAADFSKDDFEIIPGLAQENSMRKFPYDLINFPGYGENGRQIAVCSQKQHVTFVSDRLREHKFYAETDSNTLRRKTPGIRAVYLFKKKLWLKSILDIVRNGMDESRARPTVTVPLEDRVRLTSPQMIIEAVFREGMIQPNPHAWRLPSSWSGTIISTLPGWTGKTINGHIERNNASFDPPFNGIRNLPRLIQNYIVQKAQTYFEENCTRPRNIDTILKGFVPGWTHPRISFLVVDAWLGNGIGMAHTSLEEVLIRARAIEGELIEARDLGPDSLMRQLFDDALGADDPQTWSFPGSGASKPISTLPGWTGLKLHNFIYRNHTVFNDYTGLPDFIQRSVVKQADKWIKTHSGEDLYQGRLPDFQDISFAQIDKWLRNGRKPGLEKLLSQSRSSNPVLDQKSCHDVHTAPDFNN